MEIRDEGGSALKKLLTDAMHEIRDLRRRNEILSAKVEVMDLFACVLHTTAAIRSQGAAPDVAWALQKEIDEMSRPSAQESVLPARGIPGPPPPPRSPAPSEQG
jgi:hypothetical protein